MSLKYFSKDATFSFRWDQVVTGFWQRYPNPKSGHVKSEDMVERKVVGGKLITKKLMKKYSKVAWAQRFLKGAEDHMYVIEESVVDPQNKSFITYTRSINNQSIAMTAEKCVYTKHPENDETTLCKYSVWVSSTSAASGIISRVVMSFYKRHMGKTKAGLDFILNKLYCNNIEQNSTIKLPTEVKIKVPRPRTASCESNDDEV